MTVGRVLVVDDDPQIRQVIQWALEDEGFNVLTAADGRQALRVVGEGSPDLIIVDLTLPEMSGHDLVRTLRSGPALNIPVLLITADGHAPVKAQSIGAYAFLRKPFRLDEFLDVVRSGLNRP